MNRSGRDGALRRHRPYSGRTGSHALAPTTVRGDGEIPEKRSTTIVTESSPAGHYRVTILSQAPEAPAQVMPAAVVPGQGMTITMTLRI